MGVAESIFISIIELVGGKIGLIDDGRRTAARTDRSREILLKEGRAA